MNSSQKIIQQKKPALQIERRPTLLRDFLINENFSSCSSSSGFKSFPRSQVPFNNSSTTFSSSSELYSSKQRLKPSSPILVSLINAVKRISFTAVNSPSLLPRSFSRKLSKKNSSRSKKETQERKNDDLKVITVRVKDILRWKSFRDLVDQDIPSPLDIPTSPYQCSTTTTVSTTDSSSNSNGWSWCDGDFVDESLPFWSGNSVSKETVEYESEIEIGKKFLSCVGTNCTKAQETASYNAVGPLDENLLLSDYEENEQKSPVSVLDYQFREQQEPSFSTFDQSLANVEMEKQKLIYKIKQFESLNKGLESAEEITNLEEEQESELQRIQEIAMELMYHVKSTTSSESYGVDVEELLLDFFVDELLFSKKNNIKNQVDMFNWEMVRIAKDWMREECAFGWGLQPKMEACIIEMHKGGRWIKFDEDQEELALEIEDRVLDSLVDDLLLDLFSLNKSLFVMKKKVRSNENCSLSSIVLSM